MDIHLVEIIYKGNKFRSKLDAKWAVFFDECGFKWEYNAKGFGFGWEEYEPCFRLSNVDGRCGYKDDGILYVAVINSKEIPPKGYNVPPVDCPIYVVGNIPYADDIYAFFNVIAEVHYNSDLFGFDTTDGDGYPAGLFCNKFGNPELLGPDHELGNVDWGVTRQAYQKARSIRFNLSNEDNKRKSEGNATITSSEYRDLVKNYYVSVDTIKKLQAENEKLTKDADGWKHMYHGIEEKLKKEKASHQKSLEREAKLQSQIDFERRRWFQMVSDLKEITSKWAINSKSKEE
jgi:hypothetical protein